MVPIAQIVVSCSSPTNVLLDVLESRKTIASTITFENRHNHPGASNNKASKYGKKWEEVTDPRVLARL